MTHHTTYAGIEITLPVPPKALTATCWDSVIEDRVAMRIDEIRDALDTDPAATIEVVPFLHKDDERRQNVNTAGVLLVALADGVVVDAWLARLSNYHADSRLIIEDVNDWNERHEIAWLNKDN